MKHGLKMCRKVIEEYMGSGGPPLYAPLPLDRRCTRSLGHGGECKSVVPKPKEKPEFDYEERLKRMRQSV